MMQNVCMMDIYLNIITFYKLNVVDLKNMNQLDKELNISLVLTTVKKTKHL